MISVIYVCNTLFVFNSGSFKLWLIFFLNHHAPVSQANWCNMTFIAGNLYPSHSCIGWPKSSPTGIRTPAWEADDLPTELSPPLSLNLARHVQKHVVCVRYIIDVRIANRLFLTVIPSCEKFWCYFTKKSTSWKTWRGIALVQTDVACWMSWGEGMNPMGGTLPKFG